LKFVFIAPGGVYISSAPTAGLIVAKTSSIKTAADLAGKTIAVPALRSLAEITTKAWLDQNHVDVGTQKFLELPYSAMDAALAAGRVDAALIESPYLDKALASNSRVLAYCYDAIDKYFSEGGYFANEDYVNSHLSTIKKFAAVIAETARWANANQSAAAQILAKYAKAPMSVEKYHTTYQEKVDAASLQPVIDAAARFGLLREAFPVSQMIAPGLYR